MTKSTETTRQRLARAIEKDGRELAAARLQCSLSQLLSLMEGDTKTPGLRLARAIEEVYSIPMEDWLALPASRNIQIM